MRCGENNYLSSTAEPNADPDLPDKSELGFGDSRMNEDL